ncbi:MazG family protein [Frankia sp. Cppng1_Ct_nod]|uniref:nucleoside triphosphate pyrophosphohydrolase n=1 Tax=Frankia sp. Cppng1_Ct_nod TaxID=2897162 RepID=UPI00104137BF|nr:MazG family protein [Frankia sp. Cppng1_Ct_nod]
MTVRIVVLVTSPRVVPGLLDVTAWDLLRSAAVVCCGSDDHPQRGALVAAGIPVEVVAGVGSDAPAVVEALRRHASADPSRAVVWLEEPAGAVQPAGVESAGVGELGDALAAVTGPDLSVLVVEGSRDLPGAKLLDAVAVMDRLRSPGGCPWDAEQTHSSLAPYLLEEAYEAYQTIEDADHAELREELGDVLMQVLFHARIAAEGTGGDAWDVDDVAAGLTEKLVRRHPHVFGSVTVDGAAEVETNWDKIKDVEKGRRSVTEGVPLSQPALALAAKLQKRAGKVGVPADLVLGAGQGSPAEVVAGLLRPADSPPGAAEKTIGDLLFAAVALAVRAGVDPEVALRASARRFRDTLAAAEESTRAAGLDPREADAGSWRLHWPQADVRLD